MNILTVGWFLSLYNIQPFKCQFCPSYENMNFFRFFPSISFKKKKKKKNQGSIYLPNPYVTGSMWHQVNF